MMRGSQREYARHRGCSHVAVGKAIRAGRIVEALGPDGKIDFERADVLWSENTNAVKQASTGGGEKTRDRSSTRQPVEPRAPAPTKVEQPRADQAAAQQESTGAISMLRAQTMKAAFSAQREKLKFEEESKSKVDAKEVRFHAFTRGRQARDMIMGAAPSIAAMVFGLPDIGQTTMVLDQELRRLASEIADAAEKPL